MKVETVKYINIELVISTDLSNGDSNVSLRYRVNGTEKLMPVNLSHDTLSEALADAAMDILVPSAV